MRRNWHDIFQVPKRENCGASIILPVKIPIKNERNIRREEKNNEKKKLWVMSFLNYY
jgi:hypothetical protein